MWTKALSARCSAVILVIAGLPGRQGCGDFEQQGLHQCRQLALLLRCQHDAWLALIEQSQLGLFEISDFSRHSRLSPLSSRMGERLEAHRSQRAATAGFQVQNWARSTA